jgi:hypothetical protein
MTLKCVLSSISANAGAALAATNAKAINAFEEFANTVPIAMNTTGEVLNKAENELLFPLLRLTIRFFRRGSLDASGSRP